MGRRSRSGVADYESEAEKMSLAELGSEISRCIRALKLVVRLRGKKRFLKGLFGLRHSVKHFTTFQLRKENSEKGNPAFEFVPAY